MASSAPQTNIAVITARLFELILDMSFKERRDLLIELNDKRMRGRREFHRKEYFMDVDVATARGVFKGFIKNISPGGALIDTNEALAVGQNLILAFVLPDSENPVKVSGEVARVLPRGIGVRFNSAIDNITK